MRFAVAGMLLALNGLAYAQISPGPLARAHQSLSGDTNCTKCHTVSARAPSFNCLECHREIATELQQNRGLHATFPRSGPPGAACVKCHSDHNGVDFNMLHWSPTPQGFDHTKTGFALAGKHKDVKCRACHNAQHIGQSSRKLLAGKDLNHTWLGLSPSCVTCHEDKHKGRFGTRCATCHSTDDWKAAKIDTKQFDHSKTRFPLTGRHKSVECKSCHTPAQNGQMKFTGLKFSSCADCHRDPHKGGFKQECSSCHTTSSWRAARFTGTFDHSKTSFPLAGMHLKVACVTCHRGADFKTPIPHSQCADCHKPDPHGGQFLDRPDGGRCESCHTVKGWKPSTFSIADHARTGFPLIFPHAQVKCASCHVPAGKATKFKIKFAECTDCHKDEHRSQFAGAPWLNRCNKCHDGATFKSSNYTLVQHMQSRFPLTGGHEAVACIECHKPMQGSDVAVYHFQNLSCSTCHEDVHKGQFKNRMSQTGPSGKPLGCRACHTTETWKDVAKFDHAKTSFPLLGTHRAVACADCHKPPNMELTLRHVRFDAAPTACRECHENPHADQFGSRGQDCASCHNTNKWRPSLFDHNKTAFPLRGGHEDVACSACHTVKRLVAGRMVLFYKPTPVQCSACHGAAVPKKTKRSSFVPDRLLPLALQRGFFTGPA